MRQLCHVRLSFRRLQFRDGIHQVRDRSALTEILICCVCDSCQLSLLWCLKTFVACFWWRRHIGSSETEHSVSPLHECGIDCQPTSDSCVRRRHLGAILRHFYSLLLTEHSWTFMDYVMRRRSTVGGALEMFSLPLPSTSVALYGRHCYNRELRWGGEYSQGGCGGGCCGRSSCSCFSRSTAVATDKWTDRQKDFAIT